ncbi:membrane protein insertase YidC [Actinoplanes sp. NPDC051851]|uniref:YidC/Oxa1 family membrane protein insertase n=1 Tax=Actinoplanes sp. NPDC051851 TaxID=3154753 RepID=UPI003439AE1B
MPFSSIFGAVTGAAHHAITLLAGPVGAALAIVLFTLLVRLALTPLTYLQIRTERRRAALAPEMERLRAKHRDPVELATATLDLQRAHGIGPFAGLLPALAQAPFFMIMYRVATAPPPGVLAGVPLTAHLSAGLPVFAVLLAIAAAVAWWSMRRVAAAAQQLSFLRWLPWMSVAAVAWLPLAGGLYLVTSSLWTAGEQAVRRRLIDKR